MRVCLFAVVTLALALLAQSGTGRDFFVNANCSTPLPPYTNWFTAAVTIQDAVDLAAPGDTVWVTNGVYASGQVLVRGVFLPSRVAITNEILVRSVNGPADTIILGASDPQSGGCGPQALRGVYLTSGMLVGFTISNGCTLATGSLGPDTCGGGVWGLGGTISNCWIYGSRASMSGGGVYGGKLFNCLIAGNKAMGGGGAANAELTDCVLMGNQADLEEGAGGGASISVLLRCKIVGNSGRFAGGASGGSLTDCIVSNNMAALEGGGCISDEVNSSIIVDNHAGNIAGGIGGGRIERSVIVGNTARYGGGAAEAHMVNCVVANNWAEIEGGATHGGSLLNCTVVENRAGSCGGGTFQTAATNSIIYYNSAPAGGNIYKGTFVGCCIEAYTNGGGNIAEEPQFKNLSAGDYRLDSLSPCIDRGTYLPGGFGQKDIVGTTRPLDGDGNGEPAWDIGAYEFVLPSADSDRDGQTDEQELIADTDPTDPASCLRMTGIAVSGETFEVSWQGGKRATQVLEKTICLVGSNVVWNKLYTNFPFTAERGKWVGPLGGLDTGFYRIRITDNAELVLGGGLEPPPPFNGD